MIVIGLTGGIASGKSAAIKEFTRLGYDVIDSDNIARELGKKGTPVYKSIIKHFGKTMLDTKTKEINRKKLAELVFSDTKEKDKLEKIIHPAIIKEIKSRIIRYRKKKTGAVILDAPLLFEAGIKGLVDKTVVVWVPEEIQLERLMKRDKITKYQAINRINSQIPLDKKKSLADHVLDNSKSAQYLVEQINSFRKRLFYGDKRGDKI